jgi:hypothetical protein
MKPTIKQLKQFIEIIRLTNISAQLKFHQVIDPQDWREAAIEQLDDSIEVAISHLDHTLQK